MSGDNNSIPGGMGINVRLADGVNINIGADQIFGSIKNEISGAISKKLPKIPEFQIESDSDGSFRERYHERNQQMNMAAPAFQD